VVDAGDASTGRSDTSRPSSARFKLAIMLAGRHVNDDLEQPAVVRHPANLRDPGGSALA
jgi:hypothetical protein